MLELLNRTNIQELLKKWLREDGEADDPSVLLAEALEHSEIPDEYGTQKYQAVHHDWR